MSHLATEKQMIYDVPSDVPSDVHCAHWSHWTSTAARTELSGLGLIRGTSASFNFAKAQT